MSKENKKENPLDLSTKAILKRHKKWHKQWVKTNAVKYNNFKYLVRKKK